VLFNCEQDYELIRTEVISFWNQL